MPEIAVTGAAGSVGRQTLEALSSFDVTPVTHRDHDDIDGIVLDILDRGALVGAFDGHDAVVHLAADSSARASWEGAREVNIQGTYNVYDAAREAGVGRVVFGSSNHATHMYNMPSPDAVGETKPSPRVVREDDVVRPSSYYGVSKVTGEALGSYYADRHGIEVVNLRIGYLQSEADLLAHQSDGEHRARQARALYLSERDYRQAVRKAVTESIPENPLTLNLVSRNADRYHAITRAMRTIGYAPRDDSRAVIERGGGPGE